MRRPDYQFIHGTLAVFWVLVAHCQIRGGYRWLPVPDEKIGVDL